MKSAKASRAAAVALASAFAVPAPAASVQEAADAAVAADTAVAPAEAAPITVSFAAAPISDVLFAFAEFAGRSIVVGGDLTGVVSAEIRDQPWDQALGALLEAHGLVAREQESGVILVASAARLLEAEAVLPLATESFRPAYAEAAELHDMARALVTGRGRLTVGPATNTLVVTDVPRVLREVAALVAAIDVPVRQVDIAVKIVFVDRSALEGMGITYDLKDVGGNQLNFLTPGVADKNGDGAISIPEEQVPRGTDVVSLGGSSIAALGNATSRIANPTLSLLASLAMGRSTLVAFLDALESEQLTEVEARPLVRVMDNHVARVVVGEETPVRVLDAGAQVSGPAPEGRGGALPVATVDYKETGVILEVAPRITDEGAVLLDLSAERSSADLAPSDVGFVFRRQKAESRILVRNGETVVIGGLTETEKGEVRSGIPLLMDLPLLGRLFRTQSESVRRRDLLIMVTPTIVASGLP